MNKGSEGERYVAKYLTEWLTGKKRPYMFWRQDASGGMATIYVENNHMTGDICSIHKDSRWMTDIFSIEVKNGYGKTSFWQHFTSMKFNIEGFWIQTINDSTKSNKNPMLFFKKTGRRWMVGIDKYTHEKLKNGLKCLNHVVICWNKKDKLRDCYMYDMKDFFEAIKPDFIKENFS